MNSRLSAPRVSRLLGLAFALAVVPGAAHAQSGKWVATISQISIGGSADVTAETKNDKSKIKISFRNTPKERRIAWDIAIGRCRDEGPQFAPQASFQPVVTDMVGGGTATANIKKLESGKFYYVRVFDPQDSAQDSKAYGCANLVETP